MSLTELQPVLQNLSTTDKLHFIQWLISQVVSESSRHLTTTITDPTEDLLWDMVLVINAVYFIRGLSRN